MPGSRRGACFRASHNWTASADTGLICAGNPKDYAQTVLGLIADPQRLERLRRSGHASASHYTLDAMVRNFTDGVLACLRQPRLPR